MELPHVGRQCALAECRQLDFLPFRCQFCHLDYCETHWKVDDHPCANGHQARDVRVPVCPLCHKPVPVPRGEDPNLRMDTHIANRCADPGTSLSAPAYKPVCQFRTCKAKVFVSAKCPKCQVQFCLKHRFETDHQCPGPRSAPSKVIQSVLLNKFRSPSTAGPKKNLQSKGQQTPVGTPSPITVIDLDALEDKRPPECIAIE
ncbi:hypothetical protein H4R33_002326 [Dimargaris cristalligena]|uniref:AN1-type domain-containing protein n=1 Tax=Dimargaris cristalligena TaxID=215637 RepID=A0A4P9ZUJ9_9FUNG|nr:hypothetical protein H4R33_002326 [Dimargaris cristalligena]RKP36928.1 hypothetical protein BJ085DRAFT_41183 [Dimargaris cristalligena]|eukprot:RKP36928.1 hypothetical protein BJ085DRAFT_41183 [Dimargaris cristalligena]